MISGTSPSVPYVCRYDTIMDVTEHHTQMHRVKGKNDVILYIQDAFITLFLINNFFLKKCTVIMHFPPHLFWFWHTPLQLPVRNVTLEPSCEFCFHGAICSWPRWILRHTIQLVNLCWIAVLYIRRDNNWPILPIIHQNFLSLNHVTTFCSTGRKHTAIHALACTVVIRQACRIVKVVLLWICSPV